MAPTVTERAVRERVKSVGGVNPRLATMPPVGGPLLKYAERLQQQLTDGVDKPFKSVVRATLGDPQAAGNKPLTYVRQVLACAVYPPLMSEPSFPADVRDAAQTFLDSCKGGSLGSYSFGEGLLVVRRAVQRFLLARDGSAGAERWQRVVLTEGANAGLAHCFQLIANAHPTLPTGLLMPAPRYPMYAALATVHGLHRMEYFLDEDSGWELDLEELQRAMKEGERSCYPRALLVTNPGNPTGQVLSRRNMEQIVKFAHRHHLLLIADEVYQHNVYDEGTQFYSFKKVVCEMPSPYCDIELASLMSVSKGLIGECGARGGWVEFINLAPPAVAAWSGLAGATLLPNVYGQLVVYCMVAGPKPGDLSYALWQKERNEATRAQRERTVLVRELLNQAQGISCHNLQGALYAFPRVRLPRAALRAAAAASLPPDTFYALCLLEETGFCISTGTTFGWPPGCCLPKKVQLRSKNGVLEESQQGDHHEETVHLRITTLTPAPILRAALAAWRDFHVRFTLRYSSED